MKWMRVTLLVVAMAFCVLSGWLMWYDHFWKAQGTFLWAVLLDGTVTMLGGKPAKETTK